MRSAIASHVALTAPGPQRSQSSQCATYASRSPFGLLMMSSRVRVGRDRVRQADEGGLRRPACATLNGARLEGVQVRLVVRADALAVHSRPSARGGGAPSECGVLPPLPPATPSLHAGARGHSACGTATFMPNLSGRAGLKRCVLRVIQTTGGATRFRRAIAAAHDEELACAPSSARGDRPQRIARPAHARGAHTVHAPFRLTLSPPPPLLAGWFIWSRSLYIRQLLKQW